MERTGQDHIHPNIFLMDEPAPDHLKHEHSVIGKLELVERIHDHFNIEIERLYVPEIVAYSNPNRPK